MVGGEGAHLGASSLLSAVLRRTAGRAPTVRLEAERRLGEVVRELAIEGLVRSAHDISDGGLAVAAAELLFSHNPGTGMDLELAPGSDPLAALFGEDAARMLLVVAPDDVERVGERLSAHGLPHRRAARLTDDPVLRIVGVGGRKRQDLEALHEGTIPRIMQRMEASR
jgi:phosphoribosylformylglycinamidine synthase